VARRREVREPVPDRPRLLARPCRRVSNRRLAAENKHECLLSYKP
jgi:hypothetical protein